MVMGVLSFRLVSVLGAARQTGTSVCALVTTQALLVAGTAGDDVALGERTQGAAAPAQVYVATADQPLTSLPDFLQVHEFHHGPHRSWH